MPAAGLLLLVIIIWTCLLFAGIFYVSYREQYQDMDRNLSKKITPRNIMKKQSRRELLHSWMDRLSPFGSKIDLLSDPMDLEDTLVKAGYPFGLTVERIQGAKILGTLAGLFIGLVYYNLGLGFAPFMMVFFIVAGYLAPIYTLRFLAKRRQEEIRYELPDFLDMMSITLQAGMGLDDALTYYVETNPKGPLSEEISRLLQEIRFGVQREFAYRSLLKRTTSAELEALIQSLIQAHNLGTPIADTFAEQADEMRKMRTEQAKEVAGKAAPKISLVSGLVIAPSIMFLILGVIVYSYFLSPNSPIQKLF